jgi:hypothetical protein
MVAPMRTWLLACRSNRGRQCDFGNPINHYSQVRGSFNTETLGERRPLSHVIKVGCILALTAFPSLRI